MNDTPKTAAVSDSDRLVLIVLGVAAVAAGLPMVAARAAQGWLIEHQVLLPASAHPVLLLPGGQVGVDGPRLLIAAGALAALLGLGVIDVLRRRNRIEEGLR